MAPRGPESMLAAVGAAVRAAARELDDRGPAEAEALVTVPVVDQFPARAMRIEVGDRRGARRQNDFVTIAERDAVDRSERLASVG